MSETDTKPAETAADPRKSQGTPKPAKAPAGQKPAIGRVLHYHPSADDISANPRVGTKEQPYPATITHVFGDDCVNVSINDDAVARLPAPHARHSVRIVDEPKPGCCTWPQRV